MFEHSISFSPCQILSSLCKYPTVSGFLSIGYMHQALCMDRIRQISSLFVATDFDCVATRHTVVLASLDAHFLNWTKQTPRTMTCLPNSLDFLPESYIWCVSIKCSAQFTHYVLQGLCYIPVFFKDIRNITLNSTEHIDCSMITFQVCTRCANLLILLSY